MDTPSISMTTIRPFRRSSHGWQPAKRRPSRKLRNLCENMLALLSGVGTTIPSLAKRENPRWSSQSAGLGISISLPLNQTL